MGGNTFAKGINDTYDLMTGDDRAFVRWEIAFHGVQIRVAEAAGAHFNAHLTGTRRRDRKVGFAKRILFDRTRVLKK
jgi:hypothetical protein